MKAIHLFQTELGTKQRTFDFFDDGSVDLYTPGHSKVLVMTLIRQEYIYILFTSDVGYLTEY